MAVIQLRYSTVSGHVPSGLALGQLAINLADGIIFWMDAFSTLQRFNFLAPSGPTLGAGDRSASLANTNFVQGLLDTLRGGTPPVSGLDTIFELAAALGNDPNFAVAINNALVSRVRFDASQSLNGAQQAQVLANIGINTRVPTTSNADYSIPATANRIAIASLWTAAHTYTLPAATSVAPGTVIELFDEVGAVTATNILTLARTGTDLINGGVTLPISYPIFSIRFESDGVARWTAAIIGLPVALPSVIDGGSF